MVSRTYLELRHLLKCQSLSRPINSTLLWPLILPLFLKTKVNRIWHSRFRNLILLNSLFQECHRIMAFHLLRMAKRSKNQADLYRICWIYCNPTLKAQERVSTLKTVLLLAFRERKWLALMCSCHNWQQLVPRVNSKKLSYLLSLLLNLLEPPLQLPAASQFYVQSLINRLTKTEWECAPKIY